MGEPYLWRTANMSPRTCVVVKQMQSNPIHYLECVSKIKSMFIYRSRNILSSTNRKYDPIAIV